MKLRPKILLTVLAPLLFGAAVALVVVTYRSQQIIESAHAQNQRALQARAAELSLELGAGLSSLRLLASTPALKSGDLVAIGANLRAWSAGSGMFEALNYYDLGGLAHPAQGEPFSVRERDYFPDLQQGREFTAQAQPGSASGQPVLLRIVPVLGDGGRPVAALGGALRLKPMFDRITTATLDGSARLLLVDAAGHVLAGVLDGDVFSPAAADTAMASLTSAVLAALPDATAGGGVASTSLEAGGRSLRLLQAAVADAPWRLVLVEPPYELLAPLRQIRIRAALFVAAIGALGALAAWWLYRVVTRPLAALGQALDRVQAGDLTARAPVRGGDELAALGASFNRMAETLAAAEQRFRGVFDAFPHSVALSDLETGRLVEVNPAFETEFGIARSMATGRTLAEIGLVVEPQALRAQREQLKATGKIDGVLLHATQPSGEQRWAMRSARRIDLGGRPTALSVTIDVTPMKLVEARLRHSEESFTALFQSAPLPMGYASEVDGFFGSRWNQAWYRVFGYAPEVAEGRNGSQFGLWPEPEVRERYAQAVRQQGRVVGMLVSLRCANGQLRQFELSGESIDAGAGSLMMTAFVDVTEQRQSEQVLRRFGAMVEFANDAIMLTEANVFVECNQATLQMFRCTREQFIGRSPADFSPLTQPDGRPSDVAVRDTSTPVGQTLRFEWTHRRLDGETFDAEVALSGIVDQGRQRVIAVMRDISERRRAQADLLELNTTLEARVQQRTAELAQRNDELASALAAIGRVQQSLIESEQRLSRVLSATGEAVWDLDVPAGQVYNNARWCEMMGLPGDQNRRDNSVFATLLLDEERESVLSAIQDCLDGRGPYRLEHRMRRGDGSVFWVLDRGDVVERDGAGAPLRMTGSSADITERKESELALSEAKARAEAANMELTTALDGLRRAQGDLVRAEKLASLGALVAGVSHELNTPIGNAVLVASTLTHHLQVFEASMAGGLRRSVLETFVAHTREATEVLERNLRRAAELIGSFKQIAVDQASYQRRPFDLAEVVQEIAMAMSPTLRRSAVTLVDQVGAGLSMDSYPGPLGQVFMNLVNNAVIHAFEGRASGGVLVQATRLGEDRVCIVVRDDGSGIPPQHLKNIFDPFFTTRMGQGGSGLGLHIVYTIVTGLLGGHIEVHNSPGSGAEFRIELPLTAPVSKGG